MKEDLALCQRVVSAVADNLGSPLAFRAMITVLGQDLGACVGLVYGLKRDGRFRLVDFFGIDRPTANALEGLDPRDFFSPSDFSAGNVSVRSDLNPLLEAPPPPGRVLRPSSAQLSPSRLLALGFSLVVSWWDFFTTSARIPSGKPFPTPQPSPLST